LNSADDYKRLAAASALDFIQPGMVVGLGTGSTARHFVDLLGARVRDGLKVIGVPTSEATRVQAEGLGIPLATLDERPVLDVDVDGADEFDAALNLIKGGGGALLREKIVAAASRDMIVIADAAKYVERLGAFSLPIEVNPFGLVATKRKIDAALGDLGLPTSGALRFRNGHTFVTDGGHVILDYALGRIERPAELADALDRVVGVVEHGLFIKLASRAIVAGPDGIRIYEPANGGKNPAGKP